jgi:hypothetical protein
VIFNATLHEPTPEQAAAGVGPPRGPIVPLDATFEDVRVVARELAGQARAEGAEALLVGGLSSLTIALYLEAAELDLPVLEAVTERLLDERGRFVFRHRGFREIPPP